MKNDDNFGFSVSEQNAPNGPAGMKSVSKDTPVPEGEFSLFWLLQHYNKNTAAAYKAQQARKKELKKAAKAGKNTAKQEHLAPIPVPTPERQYDPQEQRQAPVEPQPKKQDPSEYSPKQFPLEGTDRDNFGETVYLKNGEERYFVSRQGSGRGNTPREQLQSGYIPTPSREDAATAYLSDDEYDKTSFWDQSDTLVSPQKPSKKASLRRVKTMEEIVIATVPFKLGRNPSEVNYVLQGNSKISGLHAMIDLYQETFYIVDKGSLNGTSLNGHRIEADGEYILESGMIISLADEQFVFEINS